MKFLERHNTLFMRQFGYRKLHSTTIALIEITDKIKKLLDEGNYVIGIYLDLTKAFDTVIMIYYLISYADMELEDTLMTFFDPIWLTEYSTRAEMEKKSIKRPVKCGVPQWSVIGPLVFILYMNDIVISVNANNIRLYADDRGFLCITKIYII